MDFVENKLFVGKAAASALAAKYGTPLYAYDASVIRTRYQELKGSITYPRVAFYYAAKANTNQHILRIIKEEGGNIDAVSPGEILAALKAGFPAERIMFTATSVTDEEMKFAISCKVLVNCDSLSQLERYGALNPGGKVSVRVNPSVGAGHHGHVITGGPESKFGIWVDDIEQAREIAEKHKLSIIGIHHHIGSGILDAGKFVEAITILLAIAKTFPGLSFIDLGGGIGIPYKPGDVAIDLKEFGSKVSSLLASFAQEYGKEVAFYFEPGRYLVAESGVLLCTVTGVKTTPTHTFVGVNTGFNHLIRPMAYGAYHEIVAVDNVVGKETKKIAIAGNICESGDVFTRDEQGVVDRELPLLKKGDVLAILNAGAYGYSMASVYNTRPRPAEVLVDGDTVTVIREADKVEDLL
jgi:diaminopimelate decarboxylase